MFAKCALGRIGRRYVHDPEVMYEQGVIRSRCSMATLLGMCGIGDDDALPPVGLYSIHQYLS
jgi:hypothetical protein